MVPGRGAVWISLGEARAEESLCVAECFVLWVRDRLAGDYQWISNGPATWSTAR